MSDHPEIPELDAAGLRRFALTVGAILAVLFGLFFPWLFGAAWPLWPWVVGGMLATWGLVAPSTLNPVYKLWMRFGLVLHRIMTPLILGIIFYGLFTPIALIMKVIGRDTMARTPDSGMDSYRVISNKPPREKMEKPF